MGVVHAYPVRVHLEPIHRDGPSGLRRSEQLHP